MAAAHEKRLKVIFSPAAARDIEDLVRIFVFPGKYGKTHYRSGFHFAGENALKMNRIFLCASMALLAFSCNLHEDKSINPKAAEAYIDANGTNLAADRIPARLTEALGQKKVLILGETHYVQEHQEYISGLMKTIHGLGYRTFLQEGMHALSWIAEDYVLGVDPGEVLPSPLNLFDDHWLWEFREYNASLPVGAEKMIFRYFDMNHWRGILKLSLTEMEKKITVNGMFDAILAAEEDTAAYQNTVQALYDGLDNNADFNGLSELWRNRIREALEIELLSLPIRRNFQDASRERIIKTLVDRSIIGSSETEKIVVNCGMNHAQKNYYPGMGPGGSYIGLGEFLNGKYPVYAVAFFGLKGERRAHYDDTSNIVFNVLTDTSPRDLIHMVAARASAPLFWLPLEDSLFEGSVDVNKVRMVPYRQFDAFLFYSTISVLASLETFRSFGASRT